MNAQTLAPPALPEGVLYDELGRTVAPLDMLDEYAKNPRNPEDYDYKLSPPFRDLVNSIDENGVREPINVYRDGNRLSMLNGHRRKRAAEYLNLRRRQAYESRLALGQLSAEDPLPLDLQPILGLPISLVPPPLTPFERQADMWVAESQRQKWPVDKLVPFYQETYETAPEEVRQDVKHLARRLGLPESRVRLLTTIVTSDVLRRAATDPTEDVLDVAGREKTMRSVARVADVVYAYRPEVALRATGRYQLDDQALESLRERVLAKASEYAKIHRIPPGVALERTAPQLRDPDIHSDDDLVNWLTGPGTIAIDRLPTTVGSTGGAPQEDEAQDAGGVTPRPDLAAVLKEYQARDFDGMSSTELGNLVTELTQAGSLLDELLLEAKAARRSRVA